MSINNLTNTLFRLSGANSPLAVFDLPNCAEMKFDTVFANTVHSIAVLRSSPSKLIGVWDKTAELVDVKQCLLEAFYRRRVLDPESQKHKSLR